MSDSFLKDPKTDDVVAVGSAADKALLLSRGYAETSDPAAATPAQTPPGPSPTPRPSPPPRFPADTGKSESD